MRLRGWTLILNLGPRCLHFTHTYTHLTDCSWPLYTASWTARMAEQHIDILSVRFQKGKIGQKGFIREDRLQNLLEPEKSPKNGKDEISVGLGSGQPGGWKTQEAVTWKRMVLFRGRFEDPYTAARLGQPRLPPEALYAVYLVSLEVREGLQSPYQETGLLLMFCVVTRLPFLCE